MSVRPCSVMVVDDEAGLRRVLERVLARDGYRVIPAATAEAAYETLKTERPDALLLDIHLPTMSGLSLYLAITSEWPEMEGRIAIMTGDADADDVRSWLDHHHCAVIRKPFNLREVSDWLSATLRWFERRTGNGDPG